MAKWTFPLPSVHVFPAKWNTHQRGSETFTVDLDGLPVEVEFRMNTHGADDTLIVTPPAGYVAYPPEVTVPEGGAGTILILLEAVS